MVKLLFAGDLSTSRISGANAEFAKKVMVEAKTVFDTADYRIINFENPVMGEMMGKAIPKSGPNLIAEAESVAFLNELSVELVSLANNHTGDYGDESLFETFKALDKAHVAYAGAGKDLDGAYNAHRFEIKGVKFSVICICENEFGVAREDKAGTAGFNYMRLANKIAEEKAVSDKVLVFFHGGCENYVIPSPLCKERYRSIVDAGADALIACHTHCTQGYEYYKGKPIVYSMGNFYFPTKSRGGKWAWGYMCMLTVDGDSLTVEAIPYRNPENDAVLHLMEGKDKEFALDYIKRLSDILADDKLTRRYYDAWCMQSGINYLGSMEHFKEEHKNFGGNVADFAPTKNLFSCESHNELVGNTLNLLFFQNTEKPREDLEKLLHPLLDECAAIGDKIYE